MMLYLCRHAAAEEAGRGQSDADRALTPEGIRKFREAARGFLSLEPDVSHILTSPLLRARQTAEILEDAMSHAKIAVKVLISPALGPGSSLRGFLQAVRETRAEGIVAVGHEPFLGEWIGTLCFGRAGACELKKGAIAAIDLTSPARGELHWLLQPAHLRKLS